MNALLRVVVVLASFLGLLKADEGVSPSPYQGEGGVRVGGLSESRPRPLTLPSPRGGEGEGELRPSPRRGEGDAAARVRFEAADVYLDSGAEPLAAYQFELTAAGAEVKIVGVEGGEHPAFAGPPYYDPKALMGGRIIIAAFNTGKDLPKGRTRVVTLHVQVTGAGAPEYVAKVQAAATADGRRIPVTVTVNERKGK